MDPNAIAVAKDALKNNCVAPIPLQVLKRLDLRPLVVLNDSVGRELGACKPTIPRDFNLKEVLDITPEFNWICSDEAENEESPEDGHDENSIVRGLSELSTLVFKTCFAAEETCDIDALSTLDSSATQIPSSPSFMDLPDSESTLVEMPLHSKAATPDFQKRRIASLQHFRESAHSLIANPSYDHLHKVMRALDAIEVTDIDNEQASAIVKIAEDFLPASNGPMAVIVACEVIVRLQLAVDRSLVSWINTADISETASRAFRDAVLSQPKGFSSQLLFQISTTTRQWSKLARSQRLSEHHSYPLMTAALSWIFGPHALEADSSQATLFSRAQRAFSEFVVDIYGGWPEAGRAELLKDILNGLQSSSLPPQKVVSISLSSEERISHPAALLLDLVAEIGQVPMSVWTHAVDMRDRSILEKAAWAAHDRSLQICTEISRRLIESACKATRASAARIYTRSIIGDIARTLISPNWPAAELFISCFVSTLFRLSAVHQNRAYPSFLLDILSVIQDALASVFRQTEAPSEESKEKDTSGYFLSELQNLTIDNRRAANYLASRQLCLPNQQFYDIHLVLTCTDSIKPSRAPPGSNWAHVLQNWPISGYYTQILQLLISFAQREDIPDSHQTEALHIIEQSIAHNPQSSFDVRPILTKLRNGSYSVCEAVVRLITTYMQSSGFNRDLLEGVCARLGAPGGVSYKKRCFSLIAYYSSEDQGLAWKLILRGALDSDRGVRNASISALRKLVLDTHEEELCESLLKVHAQSPAVLRIALRDILQGIERKKVQRLVHLLLQRSLAAASVILISDGVYMPSSRVGPVFEIAIDRQSNPRDRVLCLNMLRAALVCVPRLMLGARQATAMFVNLAKWIRTCTEAEIEPSAVILWELTTQTGAINSKNQQEALERLASAALKKLESYSKSFEETREQLVTVNQVGLLAGCIRFWPPRHSLDELNDENKVRLAKMTATAQRVVEKMAKMALIVNSLPLKLMLLRTSFRVSTAYPQCFSGVDALETLFRDCTREPGQLWNQFVSLLLEYLWQQSQCSRLKITDRDRLFGENSNNLSEEAASWLLQRNLQVVLTRATDVHENGQALTALRLISRAVEDGRIDVDRCLPPVIELTSSPNAEVAQLARYTFECICEKWPAHAMQRFIEGISLIAGKHDGSVNSVVISKLWNSLQMQTRSMKPVIVRLASALRSCSCSFAALIVDGLSRVSFRNGRDRDTLASNLEDLAYSCNPNSERVTASDLARLCLYLVFSQWLRFDHEAEEKEHPPYLASSDMLLRLQQSREFAKETFEKLLDLPEKGWGTPEVHQLVHPVSEPPHKKMRT